MRRLTLAIVALGCLALALGTFMGTNVGSPLTVTLKAQTGCTQSCSFGEPDAKDKEDHFSFCHVDHGGEAHVICPDSSSIATPHLSRHETDFCINTEQDLLDCLAKK